MISASIVLDSVAPCGVRLTTFELVYPRFIHSELMTHRVFSRNAASSRAIPVQKMLDQVRDQPAMPVHWGRNQPGMQADVQLVDPAPAVERWKAAAQDAYWNARALMNLGVHKQVANRLLEPFQIMKTLVTATEFDNFYALRTHRDAQPELRELALQMRSVQEGSKPRQCRKYYPHTPFVPDLNELVGQYSWREIQLISAGRCARISYSNHGTGSAPANDLALANRLMAAGHMSPFEHVAYALDTDEWHGNFRGWKQLRKTLPNEDCYQPTDAD